MKKFTFIVVIAIIFSFLIYGFDKKEYAMRIPSEKAKLKVAVSFNPIAKITEAIGGNKVSITMIIPDGTEPHDFEPRYKDMAVLSKSDLFIYNGAGMESWTDKTLEAVGSKKLVSVEASKGCKLIVNTDSGEIKEHGNYDPHVWLSLTQAVIEAGNIKDALCSKDPSNSSYYLSNYNKFKDEAEKINSYYKIKLSKVKSKDLVTGHAAFGYLCRDYGLSQNSVEDVFAEGEPGPMKMKELIDYCRVNKVNTVFLEDMVSAKVSETIAKEAGAKLKKIQTLEVHDGSNTYLQTMKNNIEEVYQSLK